MFYYIAPLVGHPYMPGLDEDCQDRDPIKFAGDVCRYLKRKTVHARG